MGGPLILYFHGNGGALVDRLPRFRLLTARGYGPLAVSYRGYSGSTGSPTQSGVMQDGEAAYREARAQGYDGDRIVLMGASRGAGVGTALAARHVVAALVLESPYFSALDVASARYAIFPVSWLMLDKFRSDLAIREVHVPVLMVHGQEDDVIPLNSAKRLFELAKAEDIRERARRQPSRSGTGGCLSARVRLDRRENLERASLRQQWLSCMRRLVWRSADLDFDPCLGGYFGITSLGTPGPSKTELVTIRVGQVKESLAPFGISRGCVRLVPRRDYAPINNT